MKTQLSIAILLFVFIPVVFSQIDLNNSTKHDTKILIDKVLEKSELNKAKLFSDYQYSFKSLVEDEKTKRKKSWLYELYCGVDGRSNCQQVLIGINDKVFSASKINKAREKASKNLISSNENSIRKEKFSYGLPFGYAAEGQNFWLDSKFYLKNCELLKTDSEKYENTKITIVRVGNCNVESEEWKKSVAFMSKTEAVIWIDEFDLSVTKMKIYPKKEFVQINEDNKPIAEVNLIRMLDGVWLYKTARLDTRNKLVFPLAKNIFEYEFFEYKRLNVEVESKETKQN